MDENKNKETEVPVEQILPEETVSKIDEIKESFYQSFTGVPIIIDGDMSGYSYYVGVSRDLYAELLKRGIV